MTTLSGASTTLYNNQLYTAGRYSAYITPYNVGSLVYDQDYTESMLVYPGSMPNGETASWSFPTTTSTLVKSFMAVGYGDYLNTAPPTPVISSRLSDITNLKEGINFSLAGNTQGYNVITDIFLTNVAGNNATNAAEVEIFLHSPTSTQTWVASERSLGSINIYGITWDVGETTNSSGNPDYCFIPANGADVASGAINVNSMLQYLVNDAGLSGSLYFNGLATGVETISGSGSWTLNNFGVAYSTTAPDPVVTIALVNQSGQTINGQEYTDSAAMKGAADPNSTVILTDSGVALAQVTANSSGAWTYSGSSLGTGYHDITATETNSYGNSSSSSVVMMLNTAVNAISEFFQYVAGQGVNGVYSADPLLNGWTAPNTNVAISDLGQKIATVSSNSAGYYAYQTTNLAVGAHNMTVSATNIFGSTATNSLNFTFS